MKDKMPSDVAHVFDQWPVPAARVLHDVRKLIFEAAEVAEVGPLAEALKWGQPAYLTPVTGAGSTIRLGLKDDGAAVFFICHTGLVDGFRTDFPELNFDGNRAILVDTEYDAAALSLCLTRALTYHRAKRKVRP